MREYLFSTQQAKGRAIDDMRNTPIDGRFEWVLREVKKNKSLKQLGGIHGVWINDRVAIEGRSIKEIRDEWKENFLFDIYIAEPIGPIQEMWVERYSELSAMVTNTLISDIDRAGFAEKFLRHSSRASMGWASLQQLKTFMSRVEQHYMSIGEPLPILDKFHKYRVAT